MILNRTTSLLICCTAIIVLLNNCKKKDNTTNDELNNVDCSTIQASYINNIKPIIDANCLTSGCHEIGSQNGDYTTHAGLKAKVDNSSLERRVIGDRSMPPSESLTLDQLKKIQCWIRSGGPNN